MKTTKKKLRTYDEWLIDSLKDPEEAQLYLKSAFEEYAKDKDLDILLHSIEAYEKTNRIYHFNQYIL